MGKMTSKLKQQKSETTTWETQSGNFTTSNKVNLYFYPPEISETKIISWKFRIDNFTNGRYGMILGRDLPTALVLDLKFS